MKINLEKKRHNKQHLEMPEPLVNVTCVANLASC